ncbi:2Fe-2S ferredoxin-type domain-containing protein [Blyttiomyces helicus]|uniref:2Fe-2S ferredoxin-type domain-containing protein n=1 Tax=Blyttiomyces helicus TaxID=388810 RepID=A0A4P9W1B1_9FUNG|nr:2Fe-2S ferredoxin-type domain-containing protein [Blyttiomyces helicus]|eukprot:RKO85894.1 2Fe-2S ferredoxin-type domain-containing protein [Blyttiomyces helicus]
MLETLPVVHSHPDPRHKPAIAQKHELRFWLNGKPVVEKNPDPNESLIHFVRRKGYTGTKLGCSEGCGCGSCTVVVESFDYATQKVVTNSVNSCLAPACSVDGKHVITIEGLGNAKKPHIVQTVIADAHGSQCGFCTPGIAMSLYAAMKKNPHADEHAIEDAFDGGI